MNSPIHLFPFSWVASWLRGSGMFPAERTGTVGTSPPASSNNEALPVIMVSHEPWGDPFQRMQQLALAMAQTRPVLYVDCRYVDRMSSSWELTRLEGESSLTVLKTELPLSDQADLAHGDPIRRKHLLKFLQTSEGQVFRNGVMGQRCHEHRSISGSTQRKATCV